MFGRKKSQPANGGGNYDSVIQNCINLACRSAQAKIPFYSFIDAFSGQADFIQQDVPDNGQQVKHKPSSIEMLCFEKELHLFVADADTLSVANSCLKAFFEITDGHAELSREHEDKRVFGVSARAKSSIIDLRAVSKPSEVPNPNGTGKVDGSTLSIFVALNAPL